MMGGKREEVEGYIVDIACLRKYPQDGLLDRARAHTRACALMAHCLESGYGLVTEEGRVVPLDVDATLLASDALRQSTREAGIRARASRVRSGEEMKTESLALV